MSHLHTWTQNPQAAFAGHVCCTQCGWSMVKTQLDYSLRCGARMATPDEVQTWEERRALSGVRLESGPGYGR